MVEADFDEVALPCGIQNVDLRQLATLRRDGNADHGVCPLKDTAKDDEDW